MPKLTHKQQISKVLETLKEYEEMAEELIDCGNSKDYAQGQAYKSLIQDLREFLIL